jgi:hypothetical protein
MSTETKNHSIKFHLNLKGNKRTRGTKDTGRLQLNQTVCTYCYHATITKGGAVISYYVKEGARASVRNFRSRFPPKTPLYHPALSISTNKHSQTQITKVCFTELCARRGKAARVRYVGWLVPY